MRLAVGGGWLGRYFHFYFVNLLLQGIGRGRNFLGGLEPIDGILIVAGFPLKAGKVTVISSKPSLFSFWSAESCFIQQLRASCQTFRARQYRDNFDNKAGPTRTNFVVARIVSQSFVEKGLASCGCFRCWHRK